MKNAIIPTNKPNVPQILKSLSKSRAPFSRALFEIKKVDTTIGQIAKKEKRLKRDMEKYPGKEKQYGKMGKEFRRMKEQAKEARVDSFGKARELAKPIVENIGELVRYGLALECKNLGIVGHYKKGKSSTVFTFSYPTPGGEAVEFAKLKYGMGNLNLLLPDLRRRGAIVGEGRVDNIPTEVPGLITLKLTQGKRSWQCVDDNGWGPASLIYMKAKDEATAIELVSENLNSVLRSALLGVFAMKMEAVFSKNGLAKKISSWPGRFFGPDSIWLNLPKSLYVSASETGEIQVKQSHSNIRVRRFKVAKKMDEALKLVEKKVEEEIGGLKEKDMPRGYLIQ